MKSTTPHTTIRNKQARRVIPAAAAMALSSVSVITNSLRLRATRVEL